MINSNIFDILEKSKNESAVQNEDGTFGFSLTVFTAHFITYIKAELVALVTTQEDKDKITAYFAEDV
jgi:hypothetical protein